jgi:hypothetical protein
MKLRFTLKVAQAVVEQPHIPVKIYGSAETVSEQMVVNRQAQHVLHDGTYSIFVPFSCMSICRVSIPNTSCGRNVAIGID